MQRVILASGSPRRRELMETVQIDCEIIKSEAPEIITKEVPWQIVEELSAQKAFEVAEKTVPEDGQTVFVIGADTIVAAEGEILGKPEDAEDARRMLTMLSGRVHSVYTGVTIIKKTGADPEHVSFFKETRVQVADMTPEEIDWYIGTGDPFDKAGAYGIQGPFMAFVEGISGDYQNVVGLPVRALYEELVQMGWKRI